MLMQKPNHLNQSHRALTSPLAVWGDGIPRRLVPISHALILTLVTLFYSASGSAVPTCRPLPDSIKIDGILSESAWKFVDTLTLVRNNDPTGGAPGVVTKVLVGWTPTHLYTAFIADSRNVKGTITEHDGALYDQDALEMFIDPDGDSKNYIELEWNCLNTSVDLTLTGPGTGTDWAWSAAGIQHVVKVKGTANKASDSDTNWILETALPWSTLQPFSKATLPPKAGERLSINFYRIDNPMGGSQELLAWSPTGVANFHKPDKFGSLIFSDQTPIVLSRHQTPKAANTRDWGYGFPTFGNLEATFNALGHQLPMMVR
jgi:hypothetical protein